MSLIQISPPAAEPISLTDLKDHLRVTQTNEDALIGAALVSAARAIEARASVALVTQQWRLTLDRVPEETVILPIAPVASIDAVAIVDAAGVPQNLDTALYEAATGSPGRLRRAGPWPHPAPRLDGVRIDFTAGFGAAAAVPEPLKQAVKLLAAHFFETREAASETRLHTVPQTVDALIAPYREPRL